MSTLRWSLALALTLPCALHAESTFSYKGAIKHWLTAGENASKEFRQVGNLVKSARIKLEARPAENVVAVLQPEFAGGLRMLDIYALVNVKALPGLALTAGQFKFPFGQNRMAPVQGLRAVDYASINTALLPGDAWDNGIKATYSVDGLKVDVASIEGAGQNLAAPAGNSQGLRTAQELSALAEYTLEGITVGASYYQGQRGATFAEPRVITGGHLRFKAAALALQAEVINRDVDRIGYQVEPLLALGSDWALIGTYERLEDYRNDKVGSTRLGGGLSWQAHEAVKITLWSQGDASGPEQSPKSSLGILQSQFDF